MTGPSERASDPSPRLIRAFRALGDPTRLALLRLLAVREHAVGDLVREVGVPQPAVSRHLRVLREAGLVLDERRARRIVYRIAPQAGAEIQAALPGLLPARLPRPPAPTPARAGAPALVSQTATEPAGAAVPDDFLFVD